MKIIELTDLHLDPKWLDQQKPCLDLILETAEKEKPDFICFTGDIYNRAFYNSDKDCIKYVLDYFEKLAEISSIVMISGTPSHDAPGSYEIFEKMSCYVLHPAKPQIINNCLFIGLPEIDKTSFMAKHKCSIKEVNHKIEQRLNHYMENYWAPVREANKDIPCIFLGHGWFVDNVEKARNNPMIGDKEIVIDNIKLAKIKADRYIFGHVHTPWISKILNGGYGGYMGFDRTPWNNTGFQPGFNLTEIINQKDEEFIDDDITQYFFRTKTTRIDYPVIRKEKFKMIDMNYFKKLKPVNCHNANVRIKLSIKKSDLLKIDLKQYEKDYKIAYNANSCEIIPDIIKEESQRITHEQAENLQTLFDKYCFFKGWIRDALTQTQVNIMQKINRLEKNVSFNTQSLETKIVSLHYLKIYNSIFSIDAQGKNCFSHDFSNDPTGLTLIAGDNGQGKSTFFGFASPYPIFIGWDYRSLKEFFPNGGHIKKIFDVNGVKHEHIISISKDKIECFWNIEKTIKHIKIITNKKGKSCIEKIWKSFLKAVQLKDFMTECEKFFGPVSSFVSTSFFAQEHWRMKKYISSLVSSSATELRKAYMEIVGISREQEKLYAREKKDGIKKEIEKLEIEKATMSKILEDKETVKTEYDKLKTEINKLDTELGIIVHDENEKQKEFDDIDKKHYEQKEIESDIINVHKSMYGKDIDKNELKSKITELQKINIDELKKQITDNDKTKSKIEKLRDEWQEVNKKRNEILEDIDCNKAAADIHKEQLSELKKSLIELNNRIDLLKQEMKMNNRKCPNCNWIDPLFIERNNDITKTIKKHKLTLEKLKEEIKGFSELIKEHEDYIIQELKKLPDDELRELEETADRLKLTLFSEEKIQEINTQITEYSQIKVYAENLKKIEIDIQKLNTELSILEKKKSPFISLQYDKIFFDLSELQTKMNNKSNEQSSKAGMLKEIKKQLEQIKKYENEITDIKIKLQQFKIDFSEWEMIEKDMYENKLPALELAVIAGEIDDKVNKKLKGKFIGKTETQDINKKGEIIDRFDIKIYNPKTGREKSFIEYSPGERSRFFAEQFSQTLREKRQQKEKIIFLFSIADEQDNAIKFIHCQEYYQNISDSISPDHTRFIMSQKSEIYQFIKNTIDIEDVGKDL